MIIYSDLITRLTTLFCYYSKKFNVSQCNYCTSEKELLSLVLALQHFDIYVTAAEGPVVVFTDHDPLVHLKNLKNNQRLRGVYCCSKIV